MRRLLLKLRIVSLAALAALAGTAVPASAAPDKIVFAWPGPSSSALAPFTFAQELGFFKDENLELDVISLDGSGTIIPQLMNGSIFSSYIALDPLIISRQPGKPNFDFRFVYNAVRNSIWEVSVLDESPIQSIKDLAGKTIGVGNLSFGNVPMTKAIVKREGISLDDVQFVAVGVGAPAFEALRNKRVDALNLWDIQDVQLQLQGTKIRLLQFPPEFRGVTSHSLPVTNKMIAEHPDLVARFGRVVAEGTVACVANPRGCLDSFWKHYPKPAPDEDEAVKREMPLLKTRLDNMMVWNDGQPKKYGIFSERDWTTDINSLRVGGLIGDTEIKLDTLYTNQFVDDFNRFDQDAVIRKAQAYKP
jgi:NitT/TauT family transport system substrate-binding protein